MFLSDRNKLAEPANKKEIETFCSLLKDEIKATVIPKIFNEIVSKINQNYKHQTGYKRGLLKGDINNRDRLANDIYAIKNGATTIKELPSFKNRNHKDQDKILKGEISKTHYGSLKELMECLNLSKNKDELLKTFENHIDSSFKSKLNMLEKENSPDVRNNPTPTN